MLLLIWQNEFTWTSELTSALPWRSGLSPVIHRADLHCKMSNGCLMGVGEASINLIVDHWVNFSYLQNPSFPECCECVGGVCVTEDCEQRQRSG